MNPIKTVTAPGIPGGLEVKFVPVDSEFAGEEGRIAGYASRFGEADQGGDIVVRGAFERSLARLAAEGRPLPFLWQHDPTAPIGVWDEVHEDATGLWVSGRILTGVSKGAEALSLLRAGAVDGLSIGYRTVRAEPSPATGGRRLLEVELWEVSLVTFPMLPSARATMPAPARAGLVAEALAAAFARDAARAR